MSARSSHAVRAALLAAVASGCGGFGSAAEAGRPSSLDRIELPAGFAIELFASGLPGARSLARSPQGTIFVGTREGRVYAVADRNRDGRPEPPRTIADGLDEPNGVDWKDGALYVVEVSRVRRFERIDEQLAKPEPPRSTIFYSGLPAERGHQWRYARFGPDGWLYVGIGAPCNVCERGEPFASIARIAPDGKRLEVWARGVRNSVGFDWQPGSNLLWFTDNGRDWLGDDEPADELNRAPRAGLHFGFPHCHGGDLVDPDHGKGGGCRDYVPPAVKLGPHVAALGMRFYRGTMFPERYRGAVFIAEHGSWNRSKPIGYRVTTVDVRGERASSYRPFAQGWLDAEGAWGRPVDLLELSDGSLLVSDDLQGSLYRITYRGK